MLGDKALHGPDHSAWTRIEQISADRWARHNINLTGLETIAVSGTDAGNFLQGQLTCNVENLKDSNLQLAALCNYQGRVIATLLLHRVGDDYFIQLPDSIADDVFKTLQKYAQFSNVEISRNATDAVVHENWRLKAIQAGIPFIFKETSEQFTPHMLSLDKLNAIDFDKGCYVGQEVIARIHYKGKSKRALFYSVFDDERHAEPGMDVIIDDTHAGTIVDACNDNGKTFVLAVLTINPLP